MGGDAMTMHDRAIDAALLARGYLVITDGDKANMRRAVAAFLRTDANDHPLKCCCRFCVTARELLQP